MTAGPRDVGPIEGREVHPGGSSAPGGTDQTPPPAPPPPPSAQDGPGGSMVPGTGSPAPDATAAGTRSQDASASAVTPAAIWSDVRASRGRDVPNSRPLPEWVRRFSWLLDDAFPVPGLPGRRVGFDGIIAIVPVAGDMVGVALSLVIVVVGIGAGVTVPTLLRMLLHIGLEALIGLVPGVGTVFNMAFKANNRNVALIERDLADRRGTRRSSLGVLVLTLGVLAIGAVMLLAMMVAGLFVLIWLLSRIF